MDSRSKHKRVRAREVALQALYQFDLLRSGSEPLTSVDDLEPFVAQATQEDVVSSYVRQLLSGILDKLTTIDGHIDRTVTHWKFERITPIDRSILRLALFEILEVSDVPPKVAINEAIELAKRYSTAQSGAFVNGVLDRVYRDLQADLQTDADLQAEWTDEETTQKTTADSRPNGDASAC